MHEPSEAEKFQAKIRLVRLDAEGSPVGVGEVFDLSGFDLYTEPQGPLQMEKQIFEGLRRKRVSMKVTPVSEEFARLLRGESGDTTAASDSTDDHVGRQEDGRI